MNRQQMDDLLVDYLYDELDSDVRQRFEAALPEFPELQAEVSAHQRTRELMGDLQEIDPPALALANIMREARLAAEPPEAQPGFFARLASFLMQPAMATAAIFVAVAGVTFFLSDEGAFDKVGAPVEVEEVAFAPERGDRSADEPAPADDNRGAAATVARVEEKKSEGEASQEMVPALAADLSEQADPAEPVAVEPGPFSPEDALAKDTKPAPKVKPKKSQRTQPAYKIAKVKAKPASSNKGDSAAGKKSADDDLPSGVFHAMTPTDSGEAPSEPAPEQVAKADPEPAPAPAAPSKDSKAGSGTHPAGLEEVKTAGSPGDAARKLIKLFDQQLASGQYPKARATLKKLAGIPGWEKDAKKRMDELAEAEKSKEGAKKLQTVKESKGQETVERQSEGDEAGKAGEAGPKEAVKEPVTPKPAVKPKPAKKRTVKKKGVKRDTFDAPAEKGSAF